MTKEEYIEELKGIKDPKLREEFAKQYHNDSLADKKVLLAKAQASLGMYEGLKAVKDATTVSPLTYAFNESESGLRNLVDPNSPSNWTNMSSDALLKVAIAGGYVKDVPEFAPEWKKREKREQFAKFLDMLGREMNDQGRRNAVREYENAKWYDPQKLVNSTLLHTYEKRAKEQALKGKGAASYGDLDAGDIGTISADVLSAALMGAGAGGISKSLADRGIRSYAGLRTGANIAGSDFGAGALGGLGSTWNRYLNTDEGARTYEFATEPLLTGALNVIATPATARQGIRYVGQTLGLNGANVNNVGIRKLMSASNELANRKYAEAALAGFLEKEEANAARTLKNSPVEPETQEAVNKMFDVLNDGVKEVPGKTYSLYDELQSLYENSARDLKLMHETEPFSPEPADFAPTDARFRMALDKKIKDLEYDASNVAAGSSAEQEQLKREAKRTLDYFKNFRDMMDNGLVDAREYLYRGEPRTLDAPVSEYVFTNGTKDVPFFELNKRVPQTDLDIMKDYVTNANAGYNVSYDNGLATKIRQLMKKYPDFGDYVLSQKTVPGYNMSFWESLGRDAVEPSYTATLGLLNEVPEGMGRKVYGAKPEVPKSWNIGKTPWTARDVLGAIGYEAQNVAGDIVKPGLVQTRLARYDKPDNSLEALEEKVDRIRQEKPEALDAAINWKYDPNLEESRQLTAEERNVVNQWRAKKLDEAMNGR